MSDLNLLPMVPTCPRCGRPDREHTFVCPEGAMIFLPGAFALKAMEKAVEAGEQIDIPALDELKPDVRIIQVTETVKIMYDLSDGWFGLVDDCGSEYDQPGGVALGLDEIDLLIVRLGELRKEMERAGVTPGKRPCHV